MAKLTTILGAERPITPEFGPPKLPKETKSNAGLKPMAVYFGENFATTWP